ncbi:MAG: hypothetical protein JHC87_10070 [Thermoleophilaceae bacterium]|nr:hypothetical protein [Thermoleophilaceae bacterium]
MPRSSKLPDPAALAQARFPEMLVGDDSSKSGYESFYLKAASPDLRRAIWIRYTVHKSAGHAPAASLWCTLFDREGGAPFAVKQTFGGEQLTVPDGGQIEIAGHVFGASLIRGEASGAGRAARWHMRVSGGGQPLLHLPEKLYGARVPRTKSLTTMPAITLDGAIEIDGQTLDVDGWRGMAGHNWGTQHAEQWVWLHGSGFTAAGADGEPTDTGQGTWIDLVIGRIKLGPFTTPWVANGAISLSGARRQLAGIGRVRSTQVSARPGHCEVLLPGDGIVVRATVDAPLEQTVVWPYADPDGSQHHALNCSVANMNLEISIAGAPPMTISSSGGAVYELGTRDTTHGLPVEPFTDG